MEHLFDSRGHHIMNEHHGCLCLKSGKIIGRYLEQQGIFVDQNGKYIGEIIYLNRLVYDYHSRHRHVIYPAQSCLGSSEASYSSSSFGPIELPPGVMDIVLNQLTEVS